MTPKINITELMADREAGTGGKWTIDKCPCNHRSCSYYGTSNGSFDQGNGYTLEDARRIARLPALEAAYIEAVGAIRIATECGDPESTGIDDDCIEEYWVFTHPDGRQWAATAEWGLGKPPHPLVAGFLGDGE